MGDFNSPNDGNGADANSTGNVLQKHTSESTGGAKGEALRQFNIAWPMIVTNLAAYFIIVLSIMFVGHLGELELSSSSFANSLASISGFTIMIGLASALETLCGQAFGARNYPLLGRYLLAAIFVLLVVSVPIAVLWWSMEWVLTSVGQDPTIALYAGRYIRHLIPALVAAAITQPIIKYLQTQSVVLPMMAFSVITSIIHVPVAYFLVYKSPIFGGFVGGAMAVNVSYWILLLQLLGYMAWSSNYTDMGRKTWGGFSSEAFGLVWPFVRLAVPSTLMVCVQFWAFEILTFLSGLLPDPQIELAFLSICLNTAGLLFTIPFGLSAAASTRVSNELGAGNPEAAKAAVRVILVISCLELCVVGAVILALGKTWARAFSSEDEVMDYTATAMPFLALNTAFDGLQGALSGVARGCGRQDLCAGLNILSVYGVGLPTGLVLGFLVSLGAKGLFIGSVTGLGCYTILVLLVVLRTNWTTISARAQRTGEGVRQPLLLE